MTEHMQLLLTCHDEIFFQTRLKTNANKFGNVTVQFGVLVYETISVMQPWKDAALALPSEQTLGSTQSVFLSHWACASTGGYFRVFLNVFN